MSYIHPDDRKIEEFIQQNIPDRSTLKTIAAALLKWFDKNIRYSRLDAPFFPLQRSDLDVLSMRSGTCGDYANLVVSVLQRLGYETGYAYVHVDCYGDEQDHICAAVRDAGKWMLIDAAQPYRKWYGFDCPHREYELLSPDAFLKRMKKEEQYWAEIAERYGNALYAGLLYAPWIHEEPIFESDDALEHIFFLLFLDKEKKATVYAYDMKYTKENGITPVMCIISGEERKFCFSKKKAEGIWDNAQWSEAYAEEDIPEEWKTKGFAELKRCAGEVFEKIKEAVDLPEIFTI